MVQNDTRFHTPLAVLFYLGLRSLSGLVRRPESCELCFDVFLIVLHGCQQPFNIGDNQ